MRSAHLIRVGVVLIIVSIVIWILSLIPPSEVVALSNVSTLKPLYGEISFYYIANPQHTVKLTLTSENKLDLYVLKKSIEDIAYWIFKRLNKTYQRSLLPQDSVFLQVSFNFTIMRDLINYYKKSLLFKHEGSNITWSFLPQRPTNITVVILNKSNVWVKYELLVSVLKMVLPKAFYNLLPLVFLWLGISLIIAWFIKFFIKMTKSLN